MAALIAAMPASRRPAHAAAEGVRNGNATEIQHIGLHQNANGVARMSNITPQLPKVA